MLIFLIRIVTYSYLLMFSGTNRDPFPRPLLFSEIANVCPSNENIGWPIFCCNILYSLCCSILLQNSSTRDRSNIIHINSVLLMYLCTNFIKIDFEIKIKFKNNGLHSFRINSIKWFLYNHWVCLYSLMS